MLEGALFEVSLLLWVHAVSRGGYSNFMGDSGVRLSGKEFLQQLWAPTSRNKVEQELGGDTALPQQQVQQQQVNQQAQPVYSRSTNIQNENNAPETERSRGISSGADALPRRSTSEEDDSEGDDEEDEGEEAHGNSIARGFHYYQHNHSPSKMGFATLLHRDNATVPTPPAAAPSSSSSSRRRRTMFSSSCDGLAANGADGHVDDQYYLNRIERGEFVRMGYLTKLGHVW